MANTFKYGGRNGEVVVTIREEETIKAVVNAFAEAMKQIGPGIVQKAKSAGRLPTEYARSIRWKVSKRGSNITNRVSAFLIAGVRGDAGKKRGTALAAHLEYGTRKNQPRPHIWPAFDDGMKDLPDALESAFDRER